MGTSTLVVVTLPFEGDILHAANVGDSRYCILRVYERTNFATAVVYMSKSQQKAFNFPFQLGWKIGDNPEKAETETHKLQQGDIVVVGSDGVFDNLSAEQIADVVQKQLQLLKGRFNGDVVAAAIAQEAFNFSLDEKYNSPFAQEAAAHNLKWRGGKSDDISVVIGMVRLAQRASVPPESDADESKGSVSSASTQDSSDSSKQSPSQSAEHTSL